MANPKKPTAIKIAAGNPGKKPLNKKEPKPEITLPDAPDFLDEEALKEWNRLGPELVKLGLISQIDRAAFAAYCQTWSRWIGAEIKMKDGNLTFITDKGFEAPSPYFTIANKCLDLMRKYLVEFGFTPAARSKVVADPKGEDDPMMAYMKRKEEREAKVKAVK